MPRLFPKPAAAIYLFLIAAGVARGQSYTISTAVGAGVPDYVAGKSASLALSVPGMIASDSAGNLFFADNNAVIRLDATTNLLTVVAGIGTTGYSGDNGPATSAQLFNPQGVALDSAGNLYIADAGNNVIRKVSNGIITTIAGTGAPGAACASGPASTTALSALTWIAVDSSGNVYVSESSNNCVIKVSNGRITVGAGTGKQGYSGNGGPALSALLNRPEGLALDLANNLYIADSGNHVVRKVTALNGTITSVAGSGACCGSIGMDGPATAIELFDPLGLAVDAAGNLYIADDARIYELTNGNIATIAGGGSVSGDGGTATSAELNSPAGLALSVSGNLYVWDSGQIREVSGGIINTVAGTGANGDGGPATSAPLGNPVSSLALDSADNLYIANGDVSVREVSASTGTITSIVEIPNIIHAFGQVDCQTAFYEGLAFDSAGNLYVSVPTFCHIAEVSNGTLIDVAGTGVEGYTGDGGSAILAELEGPWGIAIDKTGDIYFGDHNDVAGNVSRLRKVSNGIISTIVESGELNNPYGVTLDSAGNLYIADTGNNRVVELSAKDGSLTTIAGSSQRAGFSGDGGQAYDAQLNFPRGVAIDPDGNILIADAANNRVRRISAATGIITTIAGAGTAGFSGDYGPATNAELNAPYGFAIDSAGRIFVADGNNELVRVLTPSTGVPCSYSISPSSLQPSAAGAIQKINVQTTAYCAWTASGLPDWITASVPAGGTGAAALTLAIAPNGGTAREASISIAGVTVPVAQSGPSASPLITAVVNAEGGSTVIAPNTWTTISGSGLAPAGDSRIWEGSDFVNNQLPAQLDGVSVTVNGKAGYVYYISPTQVNVLTPPDALSGSVQVQVTNNGAATESFTAPAQAESPSFFVFNGGPYVAATHASGSLIGPTTLYPGASTPAKPGETVIIYANGFGSTSTPIVSGAESQSGTLSPLPAITIGGSPATVAFAGLNGAPGEFQFNVVIPSSLAAGDQPIVATYNGFTTQPGALITVQ